MSLSIVLPILHGIFQISPQRFYYDSFTLRVWLSFQSQRNIAATKHHFLQIPAHFLSIVSSVYLSSCTVIPTSFLYFSEDAVLLQKIPLVPFENYILPSFCALLHQSSLLAFLFLVFLSLLVHFPLPLKPLKSILKTMLFWPPLLERPSILLPLSHPDFKKEQSSLPAFTEILLAMQILLKC